MTKQEYFKLLDKYEEGLASSEEARLLHAYYNLFDLREDGLQDLTEAQRLRLGRDIRETIDQRILASTDGVKQVKLWPSNLSRSRVRIAIAAAVAAITLGVWIYSSSLLTSPSFRTEEKNLYTNDIAPGKNTATLTLANGKVISLDTNKSSVVVTDSVKTMTMLTASTPRGGTYKVTLPDGTNVWLNADSKISFPSQFDGKQRKILLEGEAYFEVAKVRASARAGAARRDLLPFIVESAGQQVEVLGTHFNVNSYADGGSVKTTLLEGSVRVNDVVIKPNQQAILRGSGNLSVNNVDAAETVLWKSGKFSFASEEIGSIMKQVSRWYDVAVIYRDNVQATKVTGSVSRFANISVLLEKLEQTGLVHFKVEGRKVYVSR